MSHSALLSPSPQSPSATGESPSDYVLRRITECSGPQLPCYQAGSIMSGFWTRFGPDKGMAICRQAFDVHRGRWQHAPVTVLRFQPSQDEFFAIPLLAEAEAASGA